MPFTFTAPTSDTAARWLRETVVLLEKLTPDQQREWLADWQEAVRHWPCSKNISAFDKAHVQATLAKWAVQMDESGVDMIMGR